MNVRDRDLTAAELATLDVAMAAVERMPRDAADRLIRHLLRAGLYHHRTGDTAALRDAFDGLLMAVKRGTDEQYAEQIQAARERKSVAVDASVAVAALRAG